MTSRRILAGLFLFCVIAQVSWLNYDRVCKENEREFKSHLTRLRGSIEFYFLEMRPFGIRRIHSCDIVPGDGERTYVATGTLPIDHYHGYRMVPYTFLFRQDNTGGIDFQAMYIGGKKVDHEAEHQRLLDRIDKAKNRDSAFDNSQGTVAVQGTLPAFAWGIGQGALNPI